MTGAAGALSMERVNLVDVKGCTMRHVTTRPVLALAGLASATVIALGAAVVAVSNQTGPTPAPPMALVGETSTPTSTAAPTQTGGPTPTGGPTSGPTATPPAEDPCSGGAVYDGGSRDWRASVDCVGFGTTALLPDHFSTRSAAEQAGQNWASHMNKSGGMVMDGPGCDPPFVLC